MLVSVGFVQFGGGNHVVNFYRKFKLTIQQLDVVKYSLWLQKIFPLGASRGAWPPNVNLRPSDIWKQLQLES